jgi:hypothetical protein
MTLYLTKSRFKLALGTKEAELLHQSTASNQSLESDGHIDSDDKGPS